MGKALVKANDDLISFCRCTSDKAFGFTGQRDCPWCGCGWMFSCTECSKAYVFAKVVETEFSAEEVAQMDLSRSFMGEVDVADEDVIEAASWYREQLEPLDLGEVCIILDGRIIPIAERNLQFDGWFARHDVEVPPQVAADGLRERIVEMLAPPYWLERKLPDETDDNRETS